MDKSGIVPPLNGTSNIPALYWVKVQVEIDVYLSLVGLDFLLPSQNASKSSIHNNRSRSLPTTQPGTNARDQMQTDRLSFAAAK